MSILGPAGKMSLVWLPVALDAVQCITPGVTSHMYSSIVAVLGISLYKYI